MIEVLETPGGPPLRQAQAEVAKLPLLDAFLVHADLDPAQVDDCRVFLAYDTKSTLRGVACVFLGFSHPALAATTLPAPWDPPVARALLGGVRRALQRSGEDPPWLAIVDEAHADEWRQELTVREEGVELHYLLPPETTLPLDEAHALEPLAPDGFDELAAFLRQHGSMPREHGIPEGLAVVARDEKGILATAGVHFLTSAVGQIANVVVREDQRGKGWGRAATAAVARRIRASGRVASLFVRGDNAPAIAVYERLGFKKVKTLAALTLA